MGNTRDTGYLQNIVQYDASNNITLPANLTVTGVITGYATTSYVGTQLGGYVPTTRTISINGTSLDLSANRSFTINSMVYPGAGIAVSTGTAWGTSLTDNSSNWNTAFGWGNHAGLYSLLNHTHTFASLTSKPTTLVGYGITDAATSAQGTSADTAYGWGNHAIAGYLTGITSGQVTTALGFTPYNATNPSGYITTAALSTYATESYVGTQIANLVASSPAALDTLNELATALGNDAAFSTTVSTALGNRLRVDTASQGLSATLQGYGRTNLGLGTAATANTGDFVAYRTFGTAANNNTGDFAAASHTHSIANVTGLQTALDGKQASGSYAAATHSHIISDVTGLQTALDGKQASLGYTPYNSTNPSGYITSSGSISGSAGSVAWTNVTGRPTALSSFTNDLGNYGGWITSSGNISGYAMSLNGYAGQTEYTILTGPANGPVIKVRYDGATANRYIDIGSKDGNGVYSEGLKIYNGSTLTFTGYTIYHTGNIPTWNQNTTGTAAYATQWGTAAGYANFSSTAISASVGWLFGTTGNGTYAPVSLASVSSLLNLSGTNTGDQTNISGYAQSLLSPNGATVVAADSAMPSSGQSFIHTLALGPSGNDGHILGMTWAGTTTSYGAQIWVDTDPTNSMAFRSRSTAGVWTSWNTVIHSSNIGSQSVSYAATAGSADTIDGWSFVNTGSNSPTNADTIASNGISYASSSVALLGQTDGALYSQAYSSSWQHQIYGDYRTGQIVVRGKNSNTWTGWRTVIDSSSIGSQSVSYASTAGTAGNITAYTINQSVGTGNSPTFVDIYANEWFRNNNVNEGLYNQSSGNHFYSGTASIWNITGASNNAVRLKFRNNHESTLFGCVYADSTTAIGFLSADENWALRIDAGKNAQIYGGLTINGSVYQGATNQGVINLLSDINVSQTNNYYRLYIPQGYVGYTQNGGMATIRVVWGQGHAGVTYSQEYKLTFGTNHGAGGNYLHSSQVTKTYSDQNPESYGGYLMDQTPAVDFYQDISGGYINFNVKGYHGQNTHRVVSIDITGGCTSTPTLTYYGASSPGGSALTVKDIPYASASGTANNITAYTINQSVGSSNSPTFAAITINGQTTINRHIDANTGWGSASGSTIFVGWSSGKVVLGNNANGGHDYARDITVASVVSTNPIFCYQDITAFSDARVKDNVEVIDNAIQKVKAIRGVTYTRSDNVDKEKRHAGVIAQEVLAVLPEVVSGSEDSVYSVAYGNMVGLLIEAIKEQQTQIESQKSEIDELKDLVQQLINR